MLDSTNIFSHYETLGINPQATAREIRDAYRKIALNTHPDRRPNDAQAEEKFKAANNAYQVLGDEEKRLAYDRELKKSQTQSASAATQKPQNPTVSPEIEKQRRYQEQRFYEQLHRDHVEFMRRSKRAEAIHNGSLLAMVGAFGVFVLYQCYFNSRDEITIPIPLQAKTISMQPQDTLQDSLKTFHYKPQ